MRNYKVYYCGLGDLQSQEEILPGMRFKKSGAEFQGSHEK